MSKSFPLNPAPHFSQLFVEEMEMRHAGHDDTAVFLLADGARLLEQRKMFTFPPLRSAGVSIALDNPAHDACAAGPLLFELDWYEWRSPSRASTLETLFRNGACSLLVSPLSMPELVQHLRRYLDVTLADGSEMMMRFYDPRVLPFWFSLLSASYLADLGAGVVEWAFFDHRLELCWLTLDGPNAKAPEARFPFEITAQQEQQLMRQCQVHTLLDRLHADPVSMLAKVALGNRYTILSVLIGKAHGYGFDGMGDLENFCRLGLQYGPDFDQRGPMKRILAGRETTAHVDELTALLTGEDWKEMGA